MSSTISGLPRIARIEFHANRKGALEAAGLPG